MAKKKASGRIDALMEGKVKRGGLKSKPSCPKPDIKPAGQGPSSKKEG